MQGAAILRIQGESGTFEVQPSCWCPVSDQGDCFAHFVLEIGISCGVVGSMEELSGHDISRESISDLRIKFPYQTSFNALSDVNDLTARYILSFELSQNMYSLIKSIDPPYIDEFFLRRRNHLQSLMLFLYDEVVGQNGLNSQAGAALAELIRIEIFDLAEECAIRKLAGGMQKWEEARILSAVSSLDASVRMSQVAEMCRISPRQLYRKFVALTGVSLSEHRAAARLDIATCRLLQSDEPIKSIALHLGFKNPASFSRFFKSRSGKSPSEFRIMNKMSNGN